MHTAFVKKRRQTLRVVPERSTIFKQTSDHYVSCKPLEPMIKVVNNLDEIWWFSHLSASVGVSTTRVG